MGEYYELQMTDIYNMTDDEVAYSIDKLIGELRRRAYIEGQKVEITRKGKLPVGHERDY